MLPGNRTLLRTNQVLADSTTTRRIGNRDVPSVAIGGGDSGGPVFLPPKEEGKQRLAAGTGTAGEKLNAILVRHRVPCDKGDETQRCYSRVAYTDMTAVLKKYTATLAQ